jgi:hypothetical protein
MMVRNINGDMIPLGTVAKITPAVGPSLISLYNSIRRPPSSACRPRATAPASR